MVSILGLSDIDTMALLQGGFHGSDMARNLCSNTPIVVFLRT